MKNVLNSIKMIQTRLNVLNIPIKLPIFVICLTILTVLQLVNSSELKENIYKKNIRSETFNTNENPILKFIKEKNVFSQSKYFKTDEENNVEAKGGDSYKCETDADCQSLNTCVDKKCHHSGFFPIQPRIVWGSIVLLIFLSLASGVGIGGGGLIIPVIIIIWNFYFYQAVPLSQALTFTNSFISFIFHLFERHPKKKNLTIDFSLGSLIIPGLLLGTTAGVFINNLFDGVLLTIILSLILIALAVKTSFKAVAMYKSEMKKQKEKEEKPQLEQSLITTKSDKEDKLESEGIKEINDDKLNIKNEDVINNSNALTNSITKSNDSNSINRKNSDATEEELEEIKEKNSTENVQNNQPKLCNMTTVFFMILSYFFFLIYIILTNTKLISDDLNVKNCELGYFLILIAFYAILITITFFIGRNIIQEYSTTKNNKINSDGEEDISEYEIKWDWKTVIRISIYSILIGITSGAVGIGGGTILSPLLLEIGVEPLVSTRTTNFLVVFTTSSSVIQYLLLGSLDLEFAVVGLIFPLFTAFIGTKVMKYIIEKTGKEYPIVVTITVTLILSSFSLMVYCIYQLATEEGAVGRLFTLMQFCNEVK